ncbi:MAG: hypothetical protein HQK68_01995, partial [Desulfamplus sp.]|nr:hypothetical protein [Desulfamplus sp.]
LTERVDSLAQAQENMSKVLNALIVDHQELRKQVGGLSMSVGYGIEDKLIPKMEAAALAEFGITVSLVDRRNITYNDGRYDEINIYCEGIKEGKSVYLIGEAKAQPGKRDFQNFSKVIGRLKSHLKIEIQAFMVGYQYSPEVESYADEHYPEIRRYKTFQLLRY